MVFTGDPIDGGGNARRQTRRRMSSSNRSAGGAAQRDEPSQVHPAGNALARQTRIALLPGQTEDAVAPLKLLQLLMYAKSTAHETLVYNPETGGTYVNPKAGGATPLHSWRGVYPTPEEALLAAREAGLEPTGIYYDIVELDASAGNAVHANETTPLVDAAPAPFRL